MPHMRWRWGLVALLGCGATGCDDEPTTRFDAVVSASREVGNAPLPVRLGVRTNGPLDAVYTYAWDFGDGESDEGAEPEHTFAAPGTYTVRVKVAAEGGGRADGTLDIVVDPSADLIAQDVAVDPRRARAGDEVTVSWGLRNGGAAVRGSWELAVFLSKDETFDAGDRELIRSQRADDPPSDRAVGFDEAIALPADLDSGGWFVGVAADPEGVVGDLDRTSNVAFAPFPLEIRNPTDNGPDLIVCAVEVPAFDRLPAGQTPIAQLGDQLPVRICLGNNGNQPTPRGGYALWLSRDEALDPEDVLVGRRDQLALGSGDRQTYDDLVDLPLDVGDGAWHLLVEADPDDAVEEQSEANNVRAWPGAFELAAAGEVEGVDLVVASLEVDADRGFWGQTLPGRVRLVNRGNVPVERTFVVRLLAEPVNGGAAIQLPSLNVPGLAARADMTIELGATITRRVEEGEYRLSAEADPTNASHDVNLGNNRRTLQRVLRLGGEPSLDPAVSDATVTPDEIDAGLAVTVAGTLRNAGADPTGVFQVAVVFSADATLDASDVVVDTFDVAGLDGGATLPVSRMVTVPLALDQQVPVWRVALVVDPAGRLSGELSEDNNVAFAPTPLVVRGATGGCAEDVENEDNDTPADAVLLAPGSHAGLGICDAADWFAIEVPAGQVLDAALTWDAAQGVLTLVAAEPDGTPRRGGEGAGGTRSLFEVAADADRTLLLRVAGARLQYALDVTLRDAPATPNLRVRAAQVTPAVAQAGADVEVRFEVANAGATQAGPSQAGFTLAGPGLVGLAVEGPAAPAVAAGESVAVSGRLSVPADLADGAYTVTIRADANGAIDEGAFEDDNEAHAVLRVDADQACQVDALEPNGSPYEPDNVSDQAAPVEVGGYDGLFVCRGDDDWYAVALAEGERLEVGVDFVHRDGDLDLTLYAPDGATVLDTSAGLQNSEQVSLLRAPAAATYLVRVHLAVGDGSITQTGYAMSVVVQAADACADDRFEPNGSSPDAVLLPDGRHDLTLCPGDEDWFRFSIPAGNTVSFQVASGDAGVRIALFDPAGLEVGNDLRRIAHEARLSGFYRLRARVDADEPVIYQLVVAGISGVDLAVDAVRLSTGRAAAGADLRAEVDVENLRGDAARDLAVQFLLSADGQPSADDLELARAVVPVVAGASSVTLGQRLRLPRDVAAGAYQVVVVLDPERQVADVRPGNNVGTAPLQVAVACADDDPRTNEGPSTATPLGDSPLEGGVICAFTEDWYALEVAGQGSLSVTLRFEHAAGDLDLSLWDAAGERLLGESRTEAEVEVVTIDVVGAGVILVQVDGFLDAENAYTLEWSAP